MAAELRQDLAEAADSALRGLAAAEHDAARLNAIAGLAAHLVAADAYQYELAATRVATAAPVMLDAAERLLRTPGEGDAPTRFLVFAVGSIAARRLRLRSRGRLLVDLAATEFAPADFPLFLHFRALSYEGGGVADLRAGLRDERAAAERLPEHPGIAHGIADFVLSLADSGAEDVTEALLAEALDRVDLALRKNPERARFFYTRARVLRRLGRFDEARDDLVTAIDKEDRASTDHAQRIADYLMELSVLSGQRSLRALMRESDETIRRAAQSVEALQTQLAATAKDVHDAEERLAERLADAQTRTVEVVAFVAAALALVQVTAVTLSHRNTLSALLLIAGLGCVLFGAVAFGALLVRSRPRS